MPDLVAIGEARLRLFRLAMLGTIRADGSPRVSAVEPYLGSGELVFGVMRSSVKARDLARDPRCTLHSVVIDPDAGEPELSVRGRFVEVADPAIRDGDPEAWWTAFDAQLALVGTLQIAAATLLRWDLENSALSTLSWTAADGVRERRRPYP